MSRLPIRLRVTLVFALATALVLAGAGLFIYLRLGSQLDESIDNGLRSRAGDVAALLQTSRGGLDEGPTLIESDESFAQVLTPSGRVVDSTSQLGGATVLSPAELRGARTETAFLEHESVPGVEGSVRLIATPVCGVQTEPSQICANDSPGRELVAVVGSSLEDRDEALDGLATLLLIGGPIALLLVSIAGYAAAGSALRPVEAMRRRAAEISAADPDERLPIAPANDEIGRLGETLNAMLDRLEGALERERRFVDDASHELRTPLALHKTELEVALRYAKGERELRTAIGSSIEEIDRLIGLAEDLLVVARSGEGGLEIERRPVVVEELFETIRDRFSARAAQIGRSLVAEPADGLVVEGDRLRLEQALTNVVDNALRHGDGEVRLRAEAGERGVSLHVTDAGPGFTDEFAERAFERFARADSARSRGGSGLGLAIVETIAGAHGGTAGAANFPSGGADVWIELPVAPPPAPS